MKHPTSTVHLELRTSVAATDGGATAVALSGWLCSAGLNATCLSRRDMERDGEIRLGYMIYNNIYMIYIDYEKL